VTAGVFYVKGERVKKNNNEPLFSSPSIISFELCDLSKVISEPIAFCTAEGNASLLSQGDTGGKVIHISFCSQVV
jgi:hypothetical protein